MVTNDAGVSPRVAIGWILLAKLSYPNNISYKNPAEITLNNQTWNNQLQNATILNCIYPHPVRFYTRYQVINALTIQAGDGLLLQKFSREASPLFVK